MDDDIFLNWNVDNVKKTYKAKKRPSRYNIDMSDVGKPQPLTTKVAIKFLLEGKLKSKVCRYCLNITAGLSELDQIMKIGGTGNLYKVTIRDIVASFHPFKVTEDPNFPNKICQKCLDKALSAYLFTQQCERSERAMLNCFDDMYEKFEKLDPIDRPKKRGRQKLNPNYNILHAEHDKVIDYAEPIINIVNVGAEAFSKEPELNDLECTKCWQLLPNLESLINHEKVHPKTMWYHCRLCGKSFPKRNQLKKHNHRVHVLGKEPHPHVEKDFKCKECDHVTDNYIQHLQHIEKHKFRDIMEHLIEKKMNTLCVICFNNKGSNLNELDKMVCIHGGHPDLMGDKTLYHILASTLPNPRSYKYQELYVPSTAQIMNISKRPYNYGDPGIKKIKPRIHSDDYKENFVFSWPVVTTKNRFKTDNFYFYVFCDPENHIDPNNTCDIEMNVTDIENPYVSNITKLVEVVDIDEIVDELNPKIPKKSIRVLKDSAKKKTKVTKEFETEPTKKAKESKKQLYSDNIKENVSIKRPNLKKNYKKRVEAIDIEKPEANLKLSEYILPNPEYEKASNAKKRNDKLKNTLTKSENYLSNSGLHLFGEVKTNKKHNGKRFTQDFCDKCWIFKNTCKACKAYDHLAISTTSDINKATDCKFCWVFKHLKKCDYCRKPIEEHDKPKKIEMNKDNNNECSKVDKIRKIWQCSICLTNNNPDRISCHCCGTIKASEYTDMKINFGNNKSFLQANEESNHVTKYVCEEYHIDTKVESDIKAFIEEPILMDCKSNSDEVTDTSNINMQTMEIETNATFNIIDVEDMDVEENPIILSDGLDWNKSRLFNFNIDNIVATTTPFVGTTLNFNIGCTTEQKQPPRKFKKAIRNIPKAFHK